MFMYQVLTNYWQQLCAAYSQLSTDDVVGIVTVCVLMLIILYGLLGSAITSAKPNSVSLPVVQAPEQDEDDYSDDEDDLADALREVLAALVAQMEKAQQDAVNRLTSTTADVMGKLMATQAAALENVEKQSARMVTIMTAAMTSMDKHVVAHNQSAQQAMNSMLTLHKESIAAIKELIPEN